MIRTARLLLPALLVALCVGQTSAPVTTTPTPRPAASARRVPAPTPADQQKATKEIQEVYRNDYAERRLDIRQLFAARLITQADECQQPDATRYMLYREAARVAAAVGDIPTAMHAIDQLAAVYEGDAVALRVEAIDTVAAIAKPDQQFALAEAYVEASEDAVGQENFTLATKLLTKAQTAARLAQDADMISEIQKRNAAISALQLELPKIAEARRVLEKTPRDPAAAGVVGRFDAICKADWAAGLPLLAISDQKPLADLASRELAMKADLLADPAKTAALADGWWDVAESLPAGQQNTVREHAAAFYETVVQNMEGFARKKTEQRLASIAGSAGPKYTPARLPRILVGATWVFKPTRGSYRLMTFAASGQITTGVTKQESVVRLVGEKLEIYGANRQLHRRLIYDPTRGYFKPDTPTGEDPKDEAGVLLPVVPRQPPRQSQRDRDVFRTLQKTEWELVNDKGPLRHLSLTAEGHVTGRGCEEREFRVVNGRLELLHESGCILWRLDYDPRRKVWSFDPREQPDTLAAARENPFPVTLRPFVEPEPVPPKRPE